MPEAPRFRWDHSNLERVGRSREEREEERARTVVPEQESVPIEIDLRGLRAEEVPSLVERYVQDAYLMGMPFVRIIHGKGTGALRQVVREELRRSPVVARNEAAGSTEGGEGATIAHLRQS